MLHQLISGTGSSTTQSSTSMRGSRTKQKAGFRFNIQKQPGPESGGASLARKPHLNNKLEIHQGGSQSARGTSASSANSRNK